jgi:hypothetical protein
MKPNKTILSVIISWALAFQNSKLQTDKPGYSPSSLTENLLLTEKVWTKDKIFCPAV